MNCPKCNKEMIEIRGFEPDGTKLTTFTCSCGEEQIIREKPKPETLRIKLGKTSADTHLFIGNREITNCSNLKIEVNPKSVDTELTLYGICSDIEADHWQTNLILIGDRPTQIKALEEILKKLKTEEPEVPK